MNSADRLLAAADAKTRGRTLNFDRLAPFYRWMEWFSFGPWLGRARRAFLHQMSAARRALVLGDGDGRFTAALLRANRHVHVDAIDISQAMLSRLMRRAGADAGRVRTQAQDLRNWHPRRDTVYDLVVTHFFLDCLEAEDVEALAERLRPVLAPGACWVVSEFAVPKGAFGKWVAQPLIGLLYHAFRLLTGLDVRRLPDWAEALQSAGFSPVQQRPLLRGLLTSQIWTRSGRQTS